MRPGQSLNHAWAALLGSVLVLGSIAPASAFSRAAEYLIAEAGKEACSTGDGRLPKGGAEEIDLNGDGKRDLIIDGNAIMCAKGYPIGCAHDAVCSVDLYVREGPLLVQKEGFLARGYSVGRGEPPRIRLNGRDGDYTARWDGSTFKVTTDR